MAMQYDDGDDCECGHTFGEHESGKACASDDCDCTRFDLFEDDDEEDDIDYGDED